MAPTRRRPYPCPSWIKGASCTFRRRCCTSCSPRGFLSDGAQQRAPVEVGEGCCNVLQLNESNYLYKVEGDPIECSLYGQRRYADDHVQIFDFRIFDFLIFRFLFKPDVIEVDLIEGSLTASDNLLRRRGAQVAKTLDLDAVEREVRNKDVLLGQKYPDADDAAKTIPNDLHVVKVAFKYKDGEFKRSQSTDV